MKYFNIKRGELDIYGKVIQVDSEAKLEDKVKDFIENTKFCLIKQEHFKDFGGYNAAYYESDSSYKPKVYISVDEEGSISLYLKDLEDIEVYLSEISEKEAKRLKESVNKYKKLQELDME